MGPFRDPVPAFTTREDRARVRGLEHRGGGKGEGERRRERSKDARRRRNARNRNDRSPRGEFNAER